jgi:chromosome segregation ATPase
MLEQITRLS